MDGQTEGIVVERSEFFDFKITIDSAKFAGSVKCVGQNATGQLDTSARLMVQEAKGKPEFKKGLEELVECKAGDDLVAEIKVDGADKVKWSKNGEPLEVGLYDIILSNNLKFRTERMESGLKRTSRRATAASASPTSNPAKMGGSQWRQRMREGSQKTREKSE